ncbi:hypothetical protein PR202_ga23636 [Eleusine coracana subsp. coracana]|uniref:SIAH-type domain-containing protein n=1 Tax=Eleusine coracana subsp. coracana TaxID=191504 RepID=A0AAV5D5R1_ELECO|nr:hypothetical protein PR202_ga23636 [Eleusine coracana subsp. coracana]
MVYRLERSYGMERAIQSFLVDCWYANHGCQEKTTYYEKERHKKACPHVPCSCPYSSGCGFAGQAAELWDHLTAHHKCPRLEFEYRLEFDLRVEPAIHVLRGIDDGQLILYGTSTKDYLRCSVTDSNPTPVDYLCFVPKVSDGPDNEDAGVWLTIKKDDWDDRSYTDTIEDSAHIVRDTSSEFEHG